MFIMGFSPGGRLPRARARGAVLTLVRVLFVSPRLNVILKTNFRRRSGGDFLKVSRDVTQVPTYLGKH